MIWTKETTAGKSSTLMSSGFLLSKACCVLCWELELSSWPLLQVSIQDQPGLSSLWKPDQLYFFLLMVDNFFSSSKAKTKHKILAPSYHFFLYESVDFDVICSYYHHGIAGNVQRTPPRRHKLCSHRPIRSDQLCVGLRLLQLLHADQRPALGVEHHPRLFSFLW